MKRAAAAAPPAHAKNAILFVGDGMGIATVTAARILAGQQRGGTGEENLLSFEELPYTAFSKTYTVDFQVGESAGTITALMTGVKTRSGVLGVDESAVRGDFAAAKAASVPTLLERAEDAGKWTGVVTTTTITHATPGGCYAHTPERNWESDAKLSPEARAAGFPDIARQLVEFSHGDGIEVALRRRSRDLPAVRRPAARALDGRDLTAEWQKRYAGAPYVATREAAARARSGEVAPRARPVRAEPPRVREHARREGADAAVARGDDRRGARHPARRARRASS